jgi:hypothetical protein
MPTRCGKNHVPPVSGTRPILERCRLCGNHQIAGQRHTHAGASGDAVDGGNGWHTQICKPHDERLVITLHYITYVRHFAIHHRHAGVGEILARTKSTASAGDHQNTDRGIVLNLIQGIADLGVHGLGKAIELIGPIQREPGDGILNGKQNMLVGHRSLS